MLRACLLSILSFFVATMSLAMPAFALTVDDLSEADVTLSSTVAGARVAATLSFVTPQPWELDGLVQVTFPVGFDVSSVSGVTTTSSLTGNFDYSVEGRRVTLERTSGSVIPASKLVDDIVIHGVITDTQPGMSLGYRMTLWNGGLTIGDNSSIAGDFLTAPSILLMAPNTGTFTAGEEVTITWDADSPITDVTIEFQVASHQDYMRIDQVPSNPGLYVWTPTEAMVTTSGKLRLTGYNAEGGLLSLDTGNFPLTILEGDTTVAEEPEPLGEPVVFVYQGPNPANYPIPDLTITTVREDQVLPRDDSAIFERLAAEFEGRLIKTASSSTVYYYGRDQKRHPFPNEATYFSWYGGFDHILELTDSQMARLQLGSRVRVRPGTWLIKIQSNDDVFAVEADGTIHAIPDEETASRLYGNDWNHRIVDINPTFWSDYTVGSELAVHPDGTLVRTSSSNYVVLFNGRARSVTPSGFVLNRFDERFAIEPTAVIDFEYYTNDIVEREAPLYNLPF